MADRALYHANVGAVLNRLERYSEAVTSCNKAIKLDPGYAKAYDIRADAYEGLEQTEKAERDRETYHSTDEKTEEEEDTPPCGVARGALQRGGRGGLVPAQGADADRR